MTNNSGIINLSPVVSKLFKLVNEIQEAKGLKSALHSLTICEGVQHSTEWVSLGYSCLFRQQHTFVLRDVRLFGRLLAAEPSLDQRLDNAACRLYSLNDSHLVNCSKGIRHIYLSKTVLSLVRGDSLHLWLPILLFALEFGPSQPANCLPWHWGQTVVSRSGKVI